MSPHHPRPLYILAVAELFERTAGVLLSVLLVLYLTDQHAFSVGRATSLSGTVHALTYLAPLLGGFVADRLFGYRAAFLVGAALLLAGYVVLSLGGPSLLYLALTLLVLGQGFFRPCILVAVDRLYDRADPIRDAGFSFFYVAANVGAALGPVVGSTLKSSYGWSSSFLFAAMAMAAGLLTLAVAQGRPSDCRVSSKAQRPAVVRFAELAPVVILLLVIAIYFVAYVQSISTLMLFARDATRRTLYGYEVSVGMIAALPAVLVVTLSPLLSLLMRRLQRRGREPRTETKLVVGLVVSCLAFLVLAGACFFSLREKVPLAWLTFSLFLLTVGELLVVPLAQSLVGKLTPAALTGLTTGLWYGAMATGCWIGGFLGTVYDRWSNAAFFGLCSAVVGVATAGMGGLAWQMRKRSPEIP